MTISSLSALIPNGFESKFYQLDNLTLHALVGGKGKIPLILLAGWPQTAVAWRLVLPLLADHFKVYALEYRGQGSSQICGENYDTLTLAQDVQQFVHLLGYEKVMVVGHDIGAWVAFSFAKHFAANTLALGVLDSAIPGVVKTEFFSPENAKKVWQFFFHANVDMALAMINKNEYDYLAWYFDNKSVIKDHLSAEIVQYYVSEYTKPEAMKAGFLVYRDVPTSILQNKMSDGDKLAFPILALGGKSATGNLLLESLSPISTNIIGEVIDNCGHYLPEEQPDVVAEWIIKLRNICC